MTNNLNEYRCPNCNKLFFKGSIAEGVIEIKCKNCKSINQIEVHESKDLFLNDEKASYEKEESSKK